MFLKKDQNRKKLESNDRNFPSHRVLFKIVTFCQRKAGVLFIEGPDKTAGVQTIRRDASNIVDQHNVQ